MLCLELLDHPKQQGMCCMLTANPAVYFNGLFYSFTEHTPVPAMLRPTSKYKFTVPPFTSITSWLSGNAPTHFIGSFSGCWPHVSSPNRPIDLSAHHVFWLAVKECWQTHHRCCVIKAAGSDPSRACCSSQSVIQSQVMTHNSLVHCSGCQDGIRRSDSKGGLASEKMWTMVLMGSEIGAIKGTLIEPSLWSVLRDKYKW